MNDVFISYSRRDKVFTQKLFEALKAANRTVWADWDSIPAASDWDAEIKEGIEQTESVLFLLSPEWIKSNECRKELIHAVTMGKRLIPILYQMVDPNEVPPELAKINWVYMRDTDDFDKSFQTLCSAMDTDLDWIKTHTRIQVRAVEWDKKKRDHSFVLRGKDLVVGEQFVSEAAGKSPEPTHLQGEYILASRKDAIRRQRITLAGVTIALVVSIALGIAAVFQRQAAVLNSKISLARELTASSRTSLETDPEQSILLALQAAQITTDAGQGILSSTEDMLREAIQTSRLRYKVTIPDDQILSVTISPNGEYLAAGTLKGEIVIWKIYNVPNHMATSSDFVETVWLEPFHTISSAGNSVESVVFSRDSKLIAVSSDETGLPAVWDLDARKKLFNLQGELGYIYNVVYSPDGQILATSGEDGIVRLWNINGANILNINAHGQNRVTGLAFSPDGKKIASAGMSGQLIISDVGTGETLYTYTDEWAIVRLAYNPKGNQIAFGSTSYNVKILDLNTNEVLNTKFHKDRAAKIAFSPDGSILASAGQDAATYIINPDTGKQIFSLIGDTNDMLDVAFSPDGAYIVTGNADGDVKIWSGSIIPPSEAGSILMQEEPGTGLVFSSDGKKIITSADEPTAHVFDIKSQKTTALYDQSIWINDVAISPDQKQLAAGRENGSIIIWDAGTGKKSKELQSAENAILYDVEYSPDGKTLLSGAGYVDLWDSGSGKLLSRIDPGQDQWIRATTFSPDGKLIAAGGDTKGVLYLIDKESAKIERSLSGHLPASVIWSVDFSSDGTKLLSGAFDNTAIIWDVQTGNILHTLKGHQGGITNVAFNFDGSLAVTSSSDSTVKIWDVSTGENLYTLVANKYYPYFWVNNIAYTPDGKLLATLSEDGVIRFYYTNVQDVLALARSRVTRSLMENECKLFIHVDTCPDTLVQPEQPTSKTDHMTKIVPIAKAPVIENSNPDLRSEFGTKQVTMGFRNKTIESVQVFWITTDLVENSVRNLAPSEYTSIQVSDNTAFRVRDREGGVIFEYVTTGDGYQQVDLESTTPLGSGVEANNLNNAVEQNQLQGTTTTPNLRTLQGTTNIKLVVENESDVAVNIVLVDGNGFESIFYAIQPAETIDFDSWDSAAWRFRDLDGKLIYEYFTDNSPTQHIIIASNLKAEVTKLDSAGNERQFASPTVGLKSGDGTKEVHLKITNNTNSVIVFSWMNFDGGEEPFLEFAPGEAVDQGTSESHAWRFRDSEGNLLFEYTATDQPVQEITINADLTVTTK